MSGVLCVSVYMYVCVCVCIYVCVYEGVCICKDVFIYIVYVRMCSCIYVCVHEYLHVCMHVFVYVRSHACMYVRMCLTCVYVYLKIRTVRTTPVSKATRTPAWCSHPPPLSLSVCVLLMADFSTTFVQRPSSLIRLSCRSLVFEM